MHYLWVGEKIVYTALNQKQPAESRDVFRTQFDICGNS